jgi:hypothetical protein
VYKSCLSADQIRIRRYFSDLPARFLSLLLARLLFLLPILAVITSIRIAVTIVSYFFIIRLIVIVEALVIAPLFDVLFTFFFLVVVIVFHLLILAILVVEFVLAFLISIVKVNIIFVFVVA